MGQQRGRKQATYYIDNKLHKRASALRRRLKLPMSAIINGMIEQALEKADGDNKMYAERYAPSDKRATGT